MKWLQRLALVVLSLALVAGVGEVVARLLTPEPPKPPKHAAEKQKPVDPSLPVLTGMFDIARKNVRGIYQGVYFRTNSEGIRGPDYSAEPDDGTFRILITGDSVTMGWAVEEDLAYPSVLERLLNESAPDLPGGHDRYEVLNLGIAGVNAQFANQRLANLSAVYHPDLTIYGFTVNDIQGRHYRASRKAGNLAAWRRAFAFKDSPSVLLRTLWPRLMLAINGNALTGSRNQRDPQILDWYKNYFENPAAWADFVDGLDQHAFQVETTGICGHVFLATSMADLSPGHPFLPIYDRVAKAAGQRGLTTTKSFPHFASRDPKALRVSSYDTHPNWKGHEILATSLLEGLQKLPPECWRSARQRDAALREAAPLEPSTLEEPAPGAVDSGRP